MVNYKIVKFCRLCKKQFVVMKGEAKRIYCDFCVKRIEASNKRDEEEALKKGKAE